MESYLDTTNNQDSRIPFIKKIIQYNTSYNSPVYTGFLNASKAELTIAHSSENCNWQWHDKMHIQLYRYC